MSKKLMSLLLVLAVVVSLFCVGASAAEAQVKLTPSPTVNAAPSPKEFKETENNDEFDQANRVYSNYLITGNAVGYEMDIFVFTLTERSDVTIVSGTAKENFAMVLCDANGNGIGVAEDDGYEDGYYYDVLYYWLEPGTYYLATGDLNENVSSKYPYEIYIYWEPHAHYWDNGVITTPPTYTATGIRTYTCLECGETKTAVEPVIPHTHSWDSGVVTTQPTYTATGIRTFTCTLCGTTKTAVEPVIPHDHVYIDTVIEPDCVYGGYTLHKCDLCGSSYTDNAVPNLGHDWSDGVCLTCGTAWEDQFVDVPKHEYYYESVMWAVENNITAGSDHINTFAPYANCTRAQVVTFLYRAAGEPEVSGENPFTDVPSGTWYHDAVLWAVEEGITVGMTETTFGPDLTCNRSQVVTFLYRAAGEPGHNVTENPFIDLTQPWYMDPVLWAYENGITQGDGDLNTFNPDGKCIRAQIVTFLFRADQLGESGEPNEPELIGAFADTSQEVPILVEFFSDGTCEGSDINGSCTTTYTVDADGNYVLIMHEGEEYAYEMVIDPEDLFDPNQPLQ